MIFGNIGDWNSEKIVFSPAIKKAMDYIKKTDFSKLSDGKYPIDGENMFAVVFEYKTTPKSENKAEVHKKYIDFQYIISGEEIIGIGKHNPENEIVEPFIEEKDYSLFKKLKNESELVMTPGTYAVFFPSDIHRPNCNLNKETTVRKAVVKIAVDIL